MKNFVFMLICILICVSGSFIPIAKAQTQDDPYAILNVPRGASEAEIKKAYQRLAMRYHPDRKPNASPEAKKQMEEQFKKIKYAYDTLSNQGQPESFSEAKADAPRAAAQVLQELKNLKSMSSETANKLLRELSDDLYSLMNSNDRKLHGMYEQIMLELTKHKRFANVETLKTLLYLEMVQDFTFGLHPLLDAWEGPHSLYTSSTTAGEILLNSGTQKSAAAKVLLAELIEYTSERIPFYAGGYSQIYDPKMSHHTAGALFQFAVQNGLVSDIPSLLAFADKYGNKILDDRQRESTLNALIRSQPEYILSMLKTAAVKDVATVIDHLYAQQQANAYEEWVRTTPREALSAAAVLEVLKAARTFAVHWTSYDFGPDFTKQGQEILADLKRINLSFVRDFHRLNPTYQQIQEFTQLSGINWGQYIMARLNPKPFGERSYKVSNSFKLRPIMVASQETSALSVKPVSCKTLLN